MDKGYLPYLHNGKNFICCPTDNVYTAIPKATALKSSQEKYHEERLKRLKNTAEKKVKNIFQKH